MIIELIRKELIFKNERSGKSKLAFLYLLLKAVAILILMGLEFFVFTSLDDKISKYSENAMYYFLVLFLFAIMIISIISSSVRARVSIFSKRDAKITLTLPISSETLVIAKMIYIYVKEVLITFVLACPLLVAYGYSRSLPPYFYVFTLFYPVIISLFSVSFSLIVVIIFEYIYELIKLNSFVQLILAAVVVIGLCYLYQFVLQMFLNALNDSSVGGMFSKDFINGLEKIVTFFMPVNPILSVVILKTNVLSNTFIFLGIILVTLVLGVFIASYVYSKYSKASINLSVNDNKHHKLKVRTTFLSLLKKEFVLLFKESGNIFSYTALLIMAPFLSYVVISSLGLIIYNNMEFLLVYFPELINGFNLTLVLLFVGVINSSASLSISRERKSIQIMKYIPVDPMTQIKAKVITPIVLSTLCLLITLITLISTKQIGIETFIIGLIIGVILIISNNLLGIIWDMYDMRGKKFSVRFLNAFLAIAFPAFILIVHILLSLTYLDAIWIYVIEVCLSLILLFVSTIKYKERIQRAFKRMEVH